MELLKAGLILNEIPLFSGLSRKERVFIEQRSRILEYKKNELIYEEDSPPSAFYCIISGRAVVFRRDRHGNEKTLEYLHRGKYFGIISLLTGEPHSVTAKAINDCFLLVIKKEDFDLVLKKIPALAIDLSKTLCRRLKRKDIHEKTIFESTIISVFSSYAKAGKSVYALNLALSLGKETHKSVILLDIFTKDKIPTIPKRLALKEDYRVFDLSFPRAEVSSIKDFIVRDAHGVDVVFLAYQQKEKDCFRRILDIASLLVNDYHYIILDLPSTIEQQMVAILNQSDLIHILSSPTLFDLKRTRSLIDSLKNEFHFPAAKIRVIINEYKFSDLTPQERSKALNQEIFATLPKIEAGLTDRLVLESPDSKYARAIRRIARQDGDCLVGLVLGVGVGYGFCHIGVLKVIEEERIPIDIICGASIGAIIASFWALGIPAAEILRITQELKTSRGIWGFMDLTFPFLGFIKGNKLYNFLKKHFGEKTFYDTKIPLKIIASDVKRKEPRVLEKGLLVEAIMASCTMPGVFKPFKFKEELLFDGGVTNPLPTEPLFEMGVKKIIAVNVTPSREDILRQYEKLKEDIIVDEKDKKRDWLNVRSHFLNKFKTNILDIIFSSFEIMQSEVAKQESQLADIVLHPSTLGLHWLELDKAVQFAKRGEEEMRENLDKVKQLIKE